MPLPDAASFLGGGSFSPGLKHRHPGGSSALPHPWALCLHPGQGMLLRPCSRSPASCPPASPLTSTHSLHAKVSAGCPGPGLSRVGPWLGPPGVCYLLGLWPLAALARESTLSRMGGQGHGQHWGCVCAAAAGSARLVLTWHRDPRTGPHQQDGAKNSLLLSCFLTPPHRGQHSPQPRQESPLPSGGSYPQEGSALVPRPTRACSSSLRVRAQEKRDVHC